MTKVKALDSKRIAKLLRKRFGEAMRLVNDEGEVLDLVLPMVPEFLESAGHPRLLLEVAGLLRDTENIHTFVAFADNMPVGFATYMVSYMPRNSTLHHWHLFVKPGFRHLTWMFYDLTKLLVEELDVDNVSYTTINPKVGEHVAKQYEKRGIEIRFTGYFYRSFHNVEKRKYKSLERKLYKQLKNSAPSEG